MSDYYPPPPEMLDSPVSLKVPPHSIDGEQSVLGGLMLDNSCWDTVSGLVSAADFYRKDHRLIFQAMLALTEKNVPMDVVTLSEALDNTNQLEAAGGLAYLSELANNTPTASNIKAYASIVHERATLRQLIQVSHEISDSCFNPEGRAGHELLDDAERKVFEIAEARPKTGEPMGIKELLSKAVNRIDELSQSGGGITGLSTGFNDLDNLTSGLQPSDLVIIAGRPSMGKTTLAMNLVESAVIGGDKPVLVFSMEMPADSLMMRMLASLGRIDQGKVRTGQLTDDDWPRLTSAINLLHEKLLFIDDTPALTPTDMRSRARRIVREHGELGMIAIDYLQLMRIAGSSENRVGEISEISRSLKALAKEFNCPIIALSQLNRSLEQRPNKRPIMSDLRESGAIEQDADVIMFIYRDEVYNEDSPDRGRAEIIIGKQRNGPIGTINLAFNGKYTRFDNLAQDSYESF
ncbi:MAG: replicative DNA helicase [Pseudomonadales bacterium]|nr:replicative DNA helicase [Pseudomonadales bacterium]